MSWPAQRVLTGEGYVRRGRALVGADTPKYLASVVVFAIPSLLAGYLAATVAQPSLVQRVAMLGLPWITVVVGAVAIMAMVGYDARGRPVGLMRATWEGLRWVPRYVWTNAHTTVIFWAPVGLLLEAHALQQRLVPLGGAGQLVVDGGWWLLVGATALFLHVRTLLAPFLAVHAELPGTEAVIEAWRLSGRHFRLCFSAFLAGALPVALPLAAGAAVLVALLPAEYHPALLAAAPNLVWVGIQAIRPLLIPTVYVLYSDLWHAELQRRVAEGAVPVPVLARPLLAVTRLFPTFGRWAEHRQ